MRTTPKIVLAPRERQVIEGLADGSTLAEVASRLSIRQGTASGYLRLAKQKLCGVSENAAALAIAYATGVIPQPQPRNPEGLVVPQAQRELVPLIARGMSGAQIATELKRPVVTVRADARALMTNLQARNPTHLVKRAWQYRLLAPDEVLAWLP